MMKIAILLGCVALAHSFKIPIGYNFGYDIKSDTDGQSRQESRDANGNVAGSYSLTDADGRQRRVIYTAGANGFNAQIESNEPGVASKSSANAIVNGASAGQIAGAIPTGYKFGYDIQSELDGQSREESGDANGRVAGSYSLRDADGRQRKVEYTADENGFKAKVDSNEHGTAAKSPADVIFISPFAAPAPVEPLTPPAVALPVGPIANFQSFVSSSGPIFESHLNTGFNGAIENKFETPISQLAVATPFEYSQKALQTPYISSGQRVYTSRTHSSTSYAKLPEAPIQQEIISKYPVQEQAIQSFTPVEIQAPLVQEYVAPIKFSPESVYTSRTHSKTSYAKLPEQQQLILPVVQAEPIAIKTPIVQEPITQQVIAKAAPIYTSRTHSSTTYAKLPEAPVQQKLVTFPVQQEFIAKPIQQEFIAKPIQQEFIAKPIQQEFISKPVQQEFIAKPIHQEFISTPVQQKIIPAPIQQQIISAPAPVYKSYSHSRIDFAKGPEPIRQEKIIQELADEKLEQRKI